MKKLIIIGLLLLVAGAFVYNSFFKNDPSDDETFAATFKFKENLTVIKNQDAKLEIKVNNSDVVKLELKLNDSLLQKWDSPQQNLSYILKTQKQKLGSKKLSLIATLSDNSSENDERFLIVLNDKAPETWSLQIEKEFPHRDSSYTQGLEFYDGVLYEGTGDPNNSGQSILAQVDINSGKFTKRNGLDASHFGEGITILNDTVYQLTWKNQKCFTYNAKDLTKYPKEFQYNGEGWGICNDGKLLIMSNGSEQIVFRNPKNFEIVRTIEVYTNKGPLSLLNELEFIDGFIYANVYTKDLIAVINPSTGGVEALIQATDICTRYRGKGEVLNGIAYNSQDKQLFITGKYWNKLLAVELDK